MRHLKRFLFLLTAIVLSLTYFAACGFEGGGEEDSDDIGAPNFDKRLDITIGTIASVGVDNSLFDYIEDKFNVKITYYISGCISTRATASARM